MYIILANCPQMDPKWRCCHRTDRAREARKNTRVGCRSDAEGRLGLRCVLTGLLLHITPVDFSPISGSRESKLSKLAVLLNALARRCTSWCHQLRSRVQTQGVNQRDIMCLLVGVHVKVQFPYWEVHPQLIFGSSFCGCSSATLESPDHENTRRKSSFATAILLRWWRMRARSKAHDPLRRSA